MADRTTTIPMDDKELFAAATAAEPQAEDTTPPAEAPKADASEERTRDEQGRFAAKQEQDTPAPAEAEAKEPVTPNPNDEGGQVPSWRMREIREERDAIARRAEDSERRAQELDRNYRHSQEQFQALARRLREVEQPKAAPDVFENPNGFLEHGVAKAIDPVQTEIAQMREFYSRKDAIREHGAENVQKAYAAVEAGMRAGDPEVLSVYQQAMRSMDPYGSIMNWHHQKTVLGKIGKDPEVWLRSELKERASKDPAFRAEIDQLLRGNAATAAADGRPNINLPPSLSKIPGSGASNAVADDSDMSDRAQFRHAVSSPRR